MHALRDSDAGTDTITSSASVAPVVQRIEQFPNLLELHRAFPERYPHLLQSTAHGRYDILFAFPGDSLVLDADGALDGPGTTAQASADFLACFDGWWQQLAGPAMDNVALPFTGGWFVYLGYELAAQVEPCLRLPRPDSSLPVALATRFTTAVIYDHHSEQLQIVGEPGQERQLAMIAADIAGMDPARANASGIVHVKHVCEEPPRRYLDAVAHIHEYIVEGDVFQVNLSRSWDIRFEPPVAAATLFENLAIHNPAPFSGLFTRADAAVISSSPERLVSVRNGIVETRPIAGTRPRSDSPAADAVYSDELLAHPKERAEHIMLIDLERNDLGRICVPGSIEVNELMVLESYAHVHHIVSNVRGRLREDILPGEVIRAVFPGGTITGCPKVRCMEIIAELEQTARGAYTGSMGYINRDGSMDLNILIRSMVSRGNRLQLRAGAGIVADSVASAELEETRAKARGLLRALGLDQA
jgi:anthranilate synthase component 1